ncbi:RNA-binding S4 domain-containing protein [Ureaplasma canigenitalium]|uniref:RNA-binding S4 domain-containing protein n=1 Tax=Ureaplasma canigenitalium TaxID=42092 RepID=UPI0004E284B4|nr:RNA-binding S4 domain-containing protein [Ureaplasma canigenitalium]
MSESTKDITKVYIDSEPMTLSQFLKFTGNISFGGLSKEFLKNNLIYVNDDKEERRGRKLYFNDKIKINKITYLLLNTKERDN